MQGVGPPEAAGAEEIVAVDDPFNTGKIGSDSATKFFDRPNHLIPLMF
jgi:hypothetical protein